MYTDVVNEYERLLKKSSYKSIQYIVYPNNSQYTLGVLSIKAIDQSGPTTQKPGPFTFDLLDLYSVSNRRSTRFYNTTTTQQAIKTSSYC